MYIYMHVCTYTHLYIHIYFTACGPPKHDKSYVVSLLSFLLW